jgi:hypothetical protein
MKARTPAELQSASDYLEFIIHMAEADMKALKHWHQASFKRNVYIDSVLIRLRSLIEFLTAQTTSCDTDVIARHYVPAFRMPEPDRRWLLDQKKLIDTTLAHLTILPMPKLISHVKFPYTEIYRKVLDGLKLFFDANPPNILDQTRTSFRRAYALREAIRRT